MLEESWEHWILEDMYLQALRAGLIEVGYRASEDELKLALFNWYSDQKKFN